MQPFSRFIWVASGLRKVSEKRFRKRWCKFFQAGWSIWQLSNNVKILMGAMTIHGTIIPVFWLLDQYSASYLAASASQTITWQATHTTQCIAQVNRKIPRTVAHYSISPKTQDIKIFCSIKLNNMKNKAVAFPSCNWNSSDFRKQ